MTTPTAINVGPPVFSASISAGPALEAGEPEEGRETE